MLEHTCRTNLANATVASKYVSVYDVGVYCRIAHDGGGPRRTLAKKLECPFDHALSSFSNRESFLLFPKRLGENIRGEPELFSISFFFCKKVLSFNFVQFHCGCRCCLAIQKFLTLCINQSFMDSGFYLIFPRAYRTPRLYENYPTIYSGMLRVFRGSFFFL